MFVLIHVDALGPYNVETHGKHRYFINIMDDYSRAIRIHLLQSKSNAFDLLKSFIFLVSMQFNKSIKAVRSDNAYELSSSIKGKMFFASQGIFHQTSCPHTP